MTINFDKLDINTLKNTTSYRYFCLLCIIIFVIETITSFYVAFVGNYAYELRHLHRAIFYAFLVNFGLSCLIYKLIRLIEKLKIYYKTDISGLNEVQKNK